VANSKVAPMVRKVLVVDDDPIIRNLMSTLLRRKGLIAAQAANGEEALTLLRNSRTRIVPGSLPMTSDFDLVLLDLMMPKVDGEGVIEWIRSDAPEMLRHVILVSAAGLERLQSIGVDCGGVLPKPFDPDMFYERVSQCLRGPHDHDVLGDPSLIAMLCLSTLLPMISR
jgi:CheY-like chemotaxis protein